MRDIFDAEPGQLKTLDAGGRRYDILNQAGTDPWSAPGTQFELPKYYQDKGEINFNPADQARLDQIRQQRGEGRRAFVSGLSLLKDRSEGRNLASTRMNEMALQRGRADLKSAARSGLGGYDPAKARAAGYAGAGLKQDMSGQAAIDAAMEKQQALGAYGKGLRELSQRDIADQVFETDVWNRMNNNALTKEIAEQASKLGWSSQALQDKEHLRNLQMSQAYDLLGAEQKARLQQERLNQQKASQLSNTMNTTGTITQIGSSILGLDDRYDKWQSERALKDQGFTDDGDGYYSWEK